MSDANDGPEGRGKRAGSGAGFSAARGAVLVAIAVIIGIVLLQAIDDGNSGPIGDGSTSSSSSTTTSTTTAAGSGGTGTSSTTAKATTLPPAETTVKVLNGSGVQGGATTVTNTLKSKGYKTLLPNTVALQKGTNIYFKDGRQTECKALTAYVPNSTVAAMPNPVPGGEDADCIVVLGT